MQTILLYVIGAAAIGYFALTIWKNLKGQGACCSSGKCSGCGSTNDCNK